MNDIIGILFQLFLIITAITVVISKNNFTVVILMSVFSLISATLYTINQAPDVAIAEVAINAAIIPLIYVIAISRQRELIIYDKLRHGDMDPSIELKGDIYGYLYNFSKKNKLKVNICCDLEGNDQAVFKDLNVDIMIDKNPSGKGYILKGKSSNVLVKKIHRELKRNEMIQVQFVEEGELLD
jgi:uncharacterized MnhB-related membrane protein